jgi:Protein of Unknown function (DUF2784)
VAIYGELADGVVAVHAAYVAFVVIGFGAILLGSACGWRWVRNPWFRIAHLIAIGLVCVEALTGVACPLTTLENRLRALGGERTYAGAFIGKLLDRLIFYDFPPWVFTLAYLGFGALVLITFIIAPPRFSRVRDRARD